LRADIAARVKYVDVTSIDDITLRLTNGPKVLWGSADQSAAKADVLAVFLGQAKHYRQIDVRTPGKPSTE
jgi:cell division protein FtsQ